MQNRYAALAVDDVNATADMDCVDASVDEDGVAPTPQRKRLRTASGSGQQRKKRTRNAATSASDAPLSHAELEALQVDDLKKFNAAVADADALRVCACCGKERVRDAIPDRSYATDDALWAPMDGE
jgi:hypothetical protein